MFCLVCRGQDLAIHFSAETEVYAAVLGLEAILQINEFFVVAWESSARTSETRQLSSKICVGGERS